ncbi:MAG: type I-B CRISPR-associated endonuclease Cas1 [Halanaerobiales bacterium]|nr:type I-B CRISPR-associated endonuclease Cas1 [Halanaerobiales bacterium]
MKSFYIFNNGDLKRKNNTFCFETEEGTRYLPIENISDVYVFGEVTLSKKFLELMTQHNIIVHFYNYFGYYTGSYYPREHYNSGYMILKQSEHYLDHEKRLKLAKSFVIGATNNIVRVLKYYNNREKDLAEELIKIENLQQLIDGCNSVEQLMAIEGNIRGNYYNCFDKILNNKNFKFEQRSKRPPKNYLNTLISFGNSVLYRVVLSQIYETHLDPRIGYLHSTNSRSFSLNLDIAEIFKPIIIDRIIFKLISKKMIKTNHFVKEMGGTFLNENGKKIFIKEFNERMETTIQHKKLNRKVSYKRLLRLECYKLQKHFMSEEEYSPYVARW